MGFAVARLRRALGPRSLLICAALALLATSALADGTARCGGKPLVIKIHADWCGTCKAQEEIWSQVQSELAEQATVVKLDVSDRVAFQESLSEAERLDIADFFARYRRRTGTIAVLACNEQTPVAILNAERDIRKYQEAISRASNPS